MFSRINRAFSKSRAEDGFTLIELLIVIVIIGILAAIAVPVFLNQQKAAINATVKSDVRNTTANVILAINKVPTATGFVVYGPGDTLATVKIVGVPNKVVTVPAGQVGVEAVRSRNNIIVINGSVAAGYEVIGCNPDTKFGWKFISNTGLFAAVPDCSAIITAASGPAPSGNNSCNGSDNQRLGGIPGTPGYVCVILSSLSQASIYGSTDYGPGFCVVQVSGPPLAASTIPAETVVAGAVVGGEAYSTTPYQTCPYVAGAVRYSYLLEYPFNRTESSRAITWRWAADRGVPSEFVPVVVTN